MHRSARTFCPDSKFLRIFLPADAEARGGRIAHPNLGVCAACSLVVDAIPPTGEETIVSPGSRADGHTVCHHDGVRVPVLIHVLDHRGQVAFLAIGVVVLTLCDLKSTVVRLLLDVVGVAHLSPAEGCLRKE